MRTAKGFLCFDNSKLPIHTLTQKRTEQIEKIAMPLLTEMLRKLRQEKPQLFKSL
jgi:hypothetical protein